MRTPPYPTQSYLKKRTMKPFRAALFALIVLLSAACSRPASDIVESSTNGLSGVRMPVQVTLREGVELAEDGPGGRRIVHPRRPTSKFPGWACGRCASIPKSPLKSDTRYKVALDASKLNRRERPKASPSFEFSTAETAFLLQPLLVAAERDDLKYYVLVGETVSSDYAADDYVEQRLKIKGLLKTRSDLDPFGGRHGPQIPGRKHPDPQRRKLQADPRLRPRPEAERRDGGPRKGEYIVLDHTVQTEPLAVVVTFSEPLKPNQDFQEPDPLRPENSGPRSTGTAYYIYPETQLTGNYEVEISREVQNKAGRRLDESYNLHRGAALAGPCDPLHGQRLHPALVQPHEPAVRIGELRPGAGARAEDLRQQPAAILPAELLRRHLFLDMEYVSRIVRDTTIDLGDKASTRLDRTNSYSLDLSRLITDSRKSMYLLEIKGVDPLIPVESNDYDYYFGDYRTLRRAVEGRHPVRHRHHLQEQRRRGADRLHHRPGLGAPERQLQGPGLRPPEPAAGRSRHRLRRTRRAEMRGRTLHGAGRG